LGNPAFGHSGEEAISKYFRKRDTEKDEDFKFKKHFSDAEWKDLVTFEGNANALRIITMHQKGRLKGGFRLTYSTIGSILKYPCESLASTKGILHRKKYGYFKIDEAVFLDIAKELNMIEDTVEGKTVFKRHPFVYLVEAADDICYALIDLEDGIILNMLSYEEVEPIFLNLIADFGLPEELHLPHTTWQQKIAALRGRVMKRLVDEVTTAFAKHHYEIITGQLKGSLLQYCSPDIEAGIQTAKNLARDRIFEHPQKSGLEIIAHQSLQTILDAFVPLTMPHKTLSFKEQRLMSILQHSGANFQNNHYNNIMQVLDIISKFSDHQAYSLAQELQGNKVGFF
jgi:dGTPase